MAFSLFLSAALAFVASLALTWWVRRLAIDHGIIDTPNARSSHSQPVPRGGGLAIVIAGSAVVACATVAGLVDRPLCFALLVGGLPIAAVGFMDDRRPVPVRVRLAVHALSAIVALGLLGGLPAMQLGDHVVDLGIAGDGLAVVAIIWTLNLFNFMDGIDGIAASEAVFVTGVGGVLSCIGAPSLAVPVAAMAIAGGSAGFLCWNWPPAKIFMGDVGSGYLGFVIAILAIAAARDSQVAVFVWLILGAVFFADAQVTLLSRLARGEKVYEAHRSHAYQVLSRRWGAHLPVTLAVIAVNLLLLMPMAWVAATHTSRAASLVTAVLAALALLTLLIGQSDRGRA